MTRFSAKDIINYRKGCNGKEKLPNIGGMRHFYPTSYKNYNSPKITQSTFRRLDENPGAINFERYMGKLNLELRTI